MTDNNKTLVSAGHELASELKADCGAVDVRSVANLLTELASALDVQSARSDALAAENAALKSGQLFFMYSDETGFEIHKSQERAIASAKDMIAVCREEAVQDGWPEDADTICWGVIMQKAIETNFEKPSEQNGWIGWSEYNLNPELETPATDAWVNEQRAAGVKMFADFWEENCRHNDTFIGGEAKKFAAQLRGSQR
ncbi:hypothetical protein [Atlantibacter subterraneus]|uniref:hypothetical protein n=1 Tax=Atlantibacter subterraneus TaxID=255519 RepID=UPI0022EB091F|nr:hypothetical protein [Atlantibacter subterranea]MDA3131730.1 hypothetical protein [Atlantibacter subterranea]